MCITTSPEVPRAFSTNGGTYGMAIKDVVIKLSPKEVLRLTRILLDEDREEALLLSERKPQAPTGQPNQGSLSACFRGFV
jgi:hypothetical protein